MTVWPGILTLFPSILAIVLSTAGIILLVSHRPAGPAVLPLYGFLIASTWWGVFLLAEGIFTNIAVKQLMAYLAVPGWFIVGTAFLFFALNFSGLRRGQEKWTAVLLWVEPVIGLVIAMTNSLHGWMWRWADYTGLNSPWLGVAARPLFYLHTLYTAAILLIGSYLLLILTSRMYRMHLRVTFLPIGVISLLISGVLSVIVTWDEGWMGIVVFLMSLAGLSLARSLLDNQDMGVSHMAEVELYERVSDGLVFISPAGLIVQVNPAVERILQEKGANLVGKPIQVILPEVNLGQDSGQAVHDLTITIDGQPHFYNVSLSVIHDSRGRHLGWSATLVDITQARQAERAAAASEERYRALFEQASDAILQADSAGSVVDANHLALELFGLSRDEILGKPVADLHPLGASEDVAPSGAYCVEAVRKDGAPLYLEISSSSLNHNDSLHTIEIVRDATDQVMADKAEQEAQAINAELRKITVEQNIQLDVNQVLGNILDRMRSIMPYDFANVFIIHNRLAVSIHARGYEPYGAEVAGRAENLVFDLESTPTLREVVEKGEIITIFDTARSPEWKRGILVDDLRSWIGAPIILGGEVIAIFSLASARAGAFYPRNAQRLRIFANQASVALENASLFDEVHKRVGELELLTVLTAILPKPATWIPWWRNFIAMFPAHLTLPICSSGWESRKTAPKKFITW